MNEFVAAQAVGLNGKATDLPSAPEPKAPNVDQKALSSSGFSKLCFDVAANLACAV
jgi:hypothetical protein